MAGDTRHKVTKGKARIPRGTDDEGGFDDGNFDDGPVSGFDEGRDAFEATETTFDADDDEAAVNTDGEPYLFENVEYTGDVEKDGLKEASVLLDGFRDRAKREAARMDAAIDNEFWFAVIFQSRAQKEAFLAALGLLLDGDKYVDGLPLAKAMKIELPPAEPVQDKHRTQPRFAALSFPLPNASTDA